MNDFIYLKEGEIQQEGDERHLKTGWERIPKNYIGQPNVGFFQIRRQIDKKEVVIKPIIEKKLTWIQKLITLFKH